MVKRQIQTVTYTILTANYEEKSFIELAPGNQSYPFKVGRVSEQSVKCSLKLVTFVFNIFWKLIYAEQCNCNFFTSLQTWETWIAEWYHTHF